MPKKPITIRVDVEILKRIERVQEASKGYVFATTVWENGARSELDKLERLYGVTDGRGSTGEAAETD